MGLCAYCRKIDLDVLDHPERIKSHHGKRIVRLRQISKWNDRVCELCCVLRALHLKQAACHGDINPVHGYSLYAYSYRKTFDAQQCSPTIAKAVEAVVLGLVRNPVLHHRSAQAALSAPYLAPSSLFASKKSTRRLNRLDTAVNIDLIRSWLMYCKKNHGDHITMRDQIPDGLDLFRVIDCKTRRIVNGDHAINYVALSYVWGCGEAQYSPSDYPGSDPLLLPEALPNVIEDAIQVVQNLNLQYLWVDRYCIRQNDAFDKHNQIAKMDLIFKRAQLTIIAAAGSSPDHGLPGVGKRLRTPQMSRRVAKHTLRVIPCHPTGTVKTAYWNTRSWTYQEAIFSQRRLIFTDEEAYFECDGMSCRESVNFGSYVSESISEVGSGLSRTKSFPELNGIPEDIWEHISEYSKRDLSYPRDILNAIMGIFRSYEGTFGRGTATHLWGVPLVRPRSLPADKSLDWTAKLLYGLSWTHSIPSHRRTGFPSWSWAGWFGGVHFLKTLTTHDPNPIVRVSVQIKESGVRQDFQDFMDQGIPISLAFPHLFLEVWTIRLEFNHLEATDFPPGFRRKPGLYAGSKFGRRYHAYAPVFLDEATAVDSKIWRRLLEEEWECILLFHDDALWYQHMRYVLLICEWDGNTAKRIGILSMEVSPCHEENWGIILDGLKKIWRTGIRLE
jgi:hypothetical protein